MARRTGGASNESVDDAYSTSPPPPCTSPHNPLQHLYLSIPLTLSLHSSNHPFYYRDLTSLSLHFLSYLSTPLSPLQHHLSTSSTSLHISSSPPPPSLSFSSSFRYPSFPLFLISLMFPILHHFAPSLSIICCLSLPFSLLPFIFLPVRLSISFLSSFLVILSFFLLLSHPFFLPLPFPSSGTYFHFPLSSFSFVSFFILPSPFSNSFFRSSSSFHFFRHPLLGSPLSFTLFTRSVFSSLFSLLIFSFFLFPSLHSSRYPFPAFLLPFTFPMAAINHPFLHLSISYLLRVFPFPLLRSTAVTFLLPFPCPLSLSLSPFM